MARPPGERRLHQRVRTARRRTPSSARWLERQLNDPYVARARAEGYRSRAAYKLAEIDEAHRLFVPGARVLDLGAAPGGWSQYAASRVGEGGHVLAVDIQDMDPIAGVDLMRLDFMDRTAPSVIRDALGGPADVVLSDMAPAATGHRQTDHLRIMGLAEAALDFAREVLAPGGVFLAKVLQGGTEGALLAAMKREFARVRHVKPKASRADSSELYVLATGFRGREGNPRAGALSAL
jgi:23S rRNA (uridine2552-2'-O)-methyltransferase